jgi:hypothetical protein
MTLPPFDGPRARQATATLNGERAVAGAGTPDFLGSPALPGSADSLGSGGAPGSPGFPGAPVSPPPARTRSGNTDPEPLNLARRPFVNTRPVERLAAILWVLGVVLLAANLTLFMGYLTNSQATRTKLAAREREIAQEQHANAQLQGQVGRLGLDQQNREVTFLNRKIDERTFSWSLLFDRMAEVLPDQVRLLRLTPSNVVQREIGLGARPSPRELNPAPVVLSMHCEAKDDEALLRFVDNLFAHPAFSEPNLENEERLDSGLLRFDLTVQYQPNPPTSPASLAPQTRKTRTRTTRTTKTTRTLETLRPLRPAGWAGDRSAAPPPYPPPATPATPASPGAAAPPPPAAVPPAPSPAGAGLMRVAPPPRRPGGGPRVPAAPGVPGRPPASAPETAAPPPAPPLRGASPGAGNPPTSGVPGMRGRR